MPKLLSLPLFLLSLIILSSCGEKPVEGDKHPNTPIFPEHSNPKIKIQPFAHLSTTGIVRSYYYGIGHELQSNTGTDKEETLFLYDKQFKLINKTLAKNIEPSPIAGYFYQIEKHEQNYHDNIKHIFQISLPSFKRKKISYINIDNEISRPSKHGIKKKYHKLFEEASKSPDFIEQSLIDSLHSDELSIYKGKLKAKVDELREGLICAKEIDTFVYVMNYTSKGINEEKIVRMVALYRQLGDKICADKAIPEFQADSIDKTVMGNAWSGFMGSNIVGQYEAYGYNYINLTIDGETTQTKVKNSEGKAGLSLVYESPEKLLLKLSSDDYFIVTKDNNL